MDVRARQMIFDVVASGSRDGEPVMLLHGFPQNKTAWSQISPVLHAAGLRTIAPDQRGYSPGARPTRVRAYRAAELARDVVAIMDRLGIPAAHIVGHDWGATVAWYVAGLHPDRVFTLTAVSVPHPLAFASAIRSDPDQRERSSYMRSFVREFAAEAHLLADDAVALGEIFRDGNLPADQVAAYVDPLRPPGALTAALSWYRAMGLTDPNDLGPIVVPTTFVWSDNDHAVGRAAAQDCATHCTGDFRFIELSGVSHWVVDEAPLTLAEAIVARVS